MKRVGWVLLLWVATLVSCNQEGASERVTQEFLKVEGLYQSEDIHVAEKALLDHRARLVSQRARGTEEIDFDVAFGIVDARLFVMYRTMGETNRAQEYFLKSVEAFRSAAAKKGRPPSEWTPESLSAMIDKYDRGLDVKWREELQP